MAKYLLGQSSEEVYEIFRLILPLVSIFFYPAIFFHIFFTKYLAQNLQLSFNTFLKIK